MGRDAENTLKLSLGSLASNLREVKRGLENGMFGPPVPLGTPDPGGQLWDNAAMHIGTIEVAICAAEELVRVRATVTTEVTALRAALRAAGSRVCYRTELGTLRPKCPQFTGIKDYWCSACVAADALNNAVEGEVV